MLFSVLGSLVLLKGIDDGERFLILVFCVLTRRSCTLDIKNYYNVITFTPASVRQIFVL